MSPLARGLVNMELHRATAASAPSSACSLGWRRKRSRCSARRSRRRAGCRRWRGWTRSGPSRSPSPPGRLTDTIAGLAKFNNTRKARQVIAEARDLLGGNGILLENHVVRHMGDIEAIHIFEGTETVQALMVGRDITGVGAFA